MENKRIPCSAIVNDRCKHGFYLLPQCKAGTYWSDRPICLMENVPKHFQGCLDDTGKPKKPLS